jgi:hypothetical protein
VFVPLSLSMMMMMMMKIAHTNKGEEDIKVAAVM